MLLKALLEEFYTLCGCKVVHQNFLRKLYIITKKLKRQEIWATKNAITLKVLYYQKKSQKTMNINYVEKLDLILQCYRNNKYADEICQKSKHKAYKACFY